MKKSNNKLIKAGAGYTIGNYLLKGLTFLTIPIFSRLMTTDEYGKFNIFVSYESILFILIGLAIHSSYKNAKYKYEKDGSYKYYVSSTMVFIVFSFVAWLAISNVFSGIIYKITDLNRLSVNLLVIYSFSSAVILCFNADASLQYKYKSFLTVSGINAVTNILISIILMLTVLKEQRYLARILGAVSPIFVLAIIVILKFLCEAKPQNVCRNLKWGLKYSLPIVPHGISQVILSQFDRIMIQRMASYSQAGIYSFAYNIYTIVNVTSLSIDNVWNPWFYEKMHENNYSAIKKTGSIYIILMAFFCGCMILVSPELIKILGSKEYFDSVYCVIPIVASGFFTFIYTLPSSIEYYYEKTKYIALGTMSAAAINIMLNYLFINRFGYVAAAYTTLATYILYFIFHYLMARRIHKSWLFSNKVVLMTSIAVIIVMFLARFLIEFWLIRWSIAIIMFATAVIYEEKYVSIINKFISKIKSKES